MTIRTTAVTRSDLVTVKPRKFGILEASPVRGTASVSPALQDGRKPSLNDVCLEALRELHTRRAGSALLVGEYDVYCDGSIVSRGERTSNHVREGERCSRRRRLLAIPSVLNGSRSHVRPATPQTVGSAIECIRTCSLEWRKGSLPAVS